MKVVKGFLEERLFFILLKLFDIKKGFGIGNDRFFLVLNVVSFKKVFFKFFGFILKCFGLKLMWMMGYCYYMVYIELECFEVRNVYNIDSYWICIIIC